MRKQNFSKVNASWDEELKYQMTCDLRGFSYPASTYRSGYHFRIDPRVDEYLFESDEQRDARAEAEEVERQRSVEKQRVVIKQIELEVKRNFTETQQQVYYLKMAGKSFFEIGQIRCTSEEAARQAWHGHPVHGGGIVRKLQKIFAETTWDSFTI